MEKPGGVRTTDRTDKEVTRTERQVIFNFLMKRTSHNFVETITQLSCGFNKHIRV